MESLSRLSLLNNIRRTTLLCKSPRKCYSNSAVYAEASDLLKRPAVSHVKNQSDVLHLLNSRKCSTFLQSVRSCSSESDENQQNTWTDLSFEDLSALINGGNIQLFDVREPKELQEYGSIPNSVNIPLGQLYDALRMPRDKFESHFGVEQPDHDDDNVVFTCLGGVRSHKALLLSKDMGYAKARHYKGGWEEWSARTNQPLKKSLQTD